MDERTVKSWWQRTGEHCYKVHGASYVNAFRRALTQQPETLQAGMYAVGCIYNFCTDHQSLGRRCTCLIAGHVGYAEPQLLPLI